MPKWISNLWHQIRGNFKYEVIRTLVLLAWGGMIAGFGVLASLIQRSLNMHNDWLVFGAIFAFSMLLFIVGSVVLRRAQHARSAQKPSVEHHVVTVPLGAFKDVQSTDRRAARDVRIELIEVPEGAKALVNVETAGLMFRGANIQVVAEGPGSGTFWIPRSGWPANEDSLYHWNVGEGFFDFFVLHIEHINPHAKEILVHLWFVTL